MTSNSSITDDELRDKHKQKRKDAGLSELPDVDISGPGGEPKDLGEALADWSSYDEREVDCLVKKDGCVVAFTQKRPKVMKGRAWPQPICPVCQITLDQAVAQNEARERRDLSLGSRMVALEVPPLYADVSFDNFELHGDHNNHVRQGKLVEACRRLVAEWPEVPGVVLFMGGSGTGKGHLAWSVAKAVIEEKGEAVRFISLPDLIRELREGWSHPAAEPESIVLERYREPPLLIIDEVSRHAYYGEPTPHLYHLINHRLNWKRPTILTTNENSDGLHDALSGPLLSRIQGENAIWNFGDVDYRQEKLPWV